LTSVGPVLGVQLIVSPAAIVPLKTCEAVFTVVALSAT
jgi:hypothetical protein